MTVASARRGSTPGHGAGEGSEGGGLRGVSAFFGGRVRGDSVLAVARPHRSSLASRTVRLSKARACAAALFALGTLGVSAAAGCSGTQYINEGPGQPFDKVRGSVPAGSLGVCKRPGTQKPPIVNPVIWEHAKPCNATTPEEYIRLGYGHSRSDPEGAKKRVDKMMEALREGQREGGNTQVLGVLRQVREEGQKDEWLKDRVFRQSARDAACDFTYLLNTMEGEYARLRKGERCAAHVYDQVDRKEVCLFDTSQEEAVWLTASWTCVARTEEAGSAMSCHRLCAYDDYCARQVSCAAPDLDLSLCALGVCLPEQKAGIY